MNSSEKLETSIKTPEQQPPPKNPEDGFEIDDEQKFEQRRDETLGDVESRASQTKEDGIARLDRTSHSYDLPEEEIASIRQENQVDEKLKSNSDEIDQLTQSTTEQIKSVGKAPESEQAPETQERNLEKERTMEGFQEKRGAILTNVLTSETVNSGLNLVPFAGGGKMLVESISGKELSGHKLSGKERIIHGAIGAGSLALDFTGIGEMSKAGVLAGRSVGLVEKVGAGLATKGAVRSARIFEKTAEFMVKHPDLTAKAELYADSKIRGVVAQIKDYQREARPVEEVQAPESVVESPPISESNLQGNEVPNEEPEKVAEKEIQQDVVAEQINPIKETVEEVEATQEAAENKNERYREKITNPEAIEMIDENSEKFHNQLKELEEKISSLEHKDSLSPEEVSEIFRNRNRIAGSLLYGQDRDRSFRHIKDLPEIEKELEKNKYWAEASDESKKYALKKGRDKEVGEQDASLFAIGIKQEDVDIFLETQSRLVKALEKTAQSITKEHDITQHDFETARYRAYYESRRTSQNVFTHVSDPESIKKIIQGGELKSKLRLKTEGQTSRTSRVEENLYFTSGGGGYLNYGGKDFAFFATTGGDILASGRSIDVATPSLKESGESGIGQQVGEYERMDGSSMPLEDLYLVANEKKLLEFQDLLEEKGYSLDWISEHLILMPSDIADEALKSAIDNNEIGVQAGDKYIKEEYINKFLKNYLLKQSKNKDKLFGTVASRVSQDYENTKIHKWQQMSGEVEEKSETSLNKAA